MGILKQQSAHWSCLNGKKKKKEEFCQRFEWEKELVADHTAKGFIYYFF